jgi:hypothetical protein
MNASDLKIDKLNRKKDENVEGSGRSPLAVVLDRVIVVLMVAILLSLSWPVCQVIWQQSRPHLARPVATQPAPMPKTEAAGAVHQDVI